MNILVCYSYVEPTLKPVSANGLIYALKAMGHNVITCGPTEGNYELPLKKGHDITVLDKRDHPECYTYKEILEQVNVKIDLIIQTDSHFYFIGEKPNIPCIYWIMDVHRSPIVFRKMAIAGKFDYIFIAQKYFMSVFERIKELNSRCYYLPWAYDSINIYDENLEPQCDIVFCGTTGIKNFEYLPRCYDEELGVCYVTGLNLTTLLIEDKFEGYDNLSFEYADRAELLIRLLKDFDVRIYDFVPVQNNIYRKILSRGRICFHRSLNRDITLRIFEGAAVNRLVVADEIPYLNEVMEDMKHLIMYRQYYQPQFSGFDLDYEEVKIIMRHYLNYDQERINIASCAKEHVLKHHTFINRATTLLNIVFGKNENFNS